LLGLLELHDLRVRVIAHCTLEHALFVVGLFGVDPSEPHGRVALRAKRTMDRWRKRRS
jgi:hypothetical protein